MFSSLQAFGDRVRLLREQRHWSQEELADRCELHRTYIGGIERGERNLGVLNVFKIARALEVEPAHLFVGLDESGNGTQELQDDSSLS